MSLGNVIISLYILQPLMVDIYEKYNLYGQLQCLMNHAKNEYEFRYMGYLIFTKDVQVMQKHVDNTIVDLLKEFELDAMVRSEQMFPTGVVIL